MKLLLDTNALIWSLYYSNVLPEHISDMLKDRDNDVSISTASLWEIEIKHNKHPNQMRHTCDSIQNDIIGIYSLLSIEPQHISRLSNLGNVHQDPFDRILMAQAEAEEMTLITSDEKIAEYGKPYVLYFRHTR